MSAASSSRPRTAWAIGRLPWRECLLALASVVFILGLFELGGQTYVSFHPAYDVLYLEPDRVVGWKEVPGLKWTWAGFYWYADEYSVQIETNAHGFRDAPREFSKPPGILRVAVLGDSYVEALQVPFEKTSAQLLEKRLNARLAPEGSQFEVLNFGISGYGLGQEFLAWEQYARRFAPDYVFVFCGTYYMSRTIDKKAGGGFPGTKENHLWIRPVFHLEKGELVRDPAQDFDAFVEKQHELIQTAFGGSRIARRPRRLFLATFPAEWKARRSRERPMLKIFRDPGEGVIALNLKILEELVREAEDQRCRVILVDTSQYFYAQTKLPTRLKSFCETRHLGYLPLFQHLLSAEAEGLRVQLPVDTHFNDLGNRITADALFDWMASHAAVTR